MFITKFKSEIEMDENWLKDEITEFIGINNVKINVEGLNITIETESKEIINQCKTCLLLIHKYKGKNCILKTYKL